MANGTLLRRSPVFIYRISIGEDHQSICINLLGEQRSGEIFINHRFTPCSVIRHRHTAAAAANHHMPLFEQQLDGFAVENFTRLRRRHHPAQIFTITFHLPAVSRFQCLLFFWLINRTNKFLWLQKRRIIRRNFNARQHRRDRRHLRLCAQTLRQHIANHPLTFCHQHIQRIRFYLFPRQILQCQQPHLRPVAVNNRQPIRTGQARQRGYSTGDIAILIFCRQRLTALE